MSLELKGDQELPLRLDGDLLGGDRLGGDRLGDLLQVDLLVWLGDLMLTECRGDLKRELRGLLSLMLRVGERVCLVLTNWRVCSISIRHRFCSSINDVCR